MASHSATELYALTIVRADCVGMSIDAAIQVIETTYAEKKENNIKEIRENVIVYSVHHRAANVTLYLEVHI